MVGSHVPKMVAVSWETMGRLANMMLMNSGFVHNDHGGISILIRLTRFGWYVLQAIEELLFFIDFTSVIIIFFANWPIVSQLTAAIFGTWLPTMTEIDYDPDLPQPCRSEKLTDPLLYSMEWKNGMLLSAAVRAICIWVFPYTPSISSFQSCSNIGYRAYSPVGLPN